MRSNLSLRHHTQTDPNKYASQKPNSNNPRVLALTILLCYSLFTTGYRIFQMPPEPSHQGPMFYCSECAHTPSTCLNNETTDSPEGPILKAHHNSPQNPTLPLVCAKTPTLRLLLPAAEKFCISPALACMLGYKLLIMKCELLFRSFAIQPQASLLLACILSPLPDVW